ncbi:MAG: DUF222 domain-containing protein, partial [Acidimicrobiia bacterium]
MLFTDPDVVVDFRAELAENNADIARLLARQLTLLNQLHRAGVAQADGARSMVDWTATTLDVNHNNAQQMVDAANRMYRTDPHLYRQFEAGDITFDRAIATLNLIGTEAPTAVIERSFHIDLTAVNRLTHQYRAITRKDEKQAFCDRYFTIQPNLDNT